MIIQQLFDGFIPGHNAVRIKKFIFRAWSTSIKGRRFYPQKANALKIPVYEYLNLKFA